MLITDDLYAITKAKKCWRTRQKGQNCKLTTIIWSVWQEKMAQATVGQEKQVSTV